MVFRGDLTGTSAEWYSLVRRHVGGICTGKESHRMNDVDWQGGTSAGWYSIQRRRSLLMQSAWT